MFIVLGQNLVAAVLILHLTLKCGQQSYVVGKNMIAMLFAVMILDWMKSNGCLHTI